jgi:hypothetical protein
MAVMTDDLSEELGAEDTKLVTLAKGARGRVGAPDGAAIRDETGRTYSAASVNLPSLSLTAIELAIASAVSSGARGLECVVAVRDLHAVTESEEHLIRHLGGATLLICQPDGAVRVRRSLGPA